MPPTLSIGAFVLGGVLLLISLLRGGGFKLFGAEVTGSAGGFGRLIAFMAGVVLIVTGFLHERKDRPERPEDPAGSISPAQPASIPAVTKQQLLPTGDNAAVQQASKDPNPVVQVVWRMAQQEMAAIVASLSDAQKLEAFQSAMATGTDIYAIHVRITNTGSVPVDISPDSLRMTFSGQTIQLSRVDDPRFLRPTRLEPSRYTEGILTLKAPTLVGGVVVAGAQLAYRHRGVQVEYAR